MIYPRCRAVLEERVEGGRVGLLRARAARELYIGSVAVYDRRYILIRFLVLEDTCIYLLSYTAIRRRRPPPSVGTGRPTGLCAPWAKANIEILEIQITAWTTEAAHALSFGAWPPRLRVARARRARRARGRARRCKTVPRPQVAARNERAPSEARSFLCAFGRDHEFPAVAGRRERLGEPGLRIQAAVTHAIVASGR